MKSARQEDLVEDPGQALSLLDDQLEQLAAAVVVECLPVREQRLRRAVSAGRRRAQLV
jgi:hypothetical protein